MAAIFDRLGVKETETMNYVLMIHAAESRFATFSKEDGEAMMQKYGSYTKDIFATGRAGDCAALEATSTATTVRLRDGQREPRLSLRDGDRWTRRHRREPRVADEREVRLFFGVGRRQELLAVEDRVGAGEHAHDLGLAG